MQGSCMECPDCGSMSFEVKGVSNEGPIKYRVNYKCKQCRCMWNVAGEVRNWPVKINWGP